jgi:hypothetical protein
VDREEVNEIYEEFRKVMVKEEKENRKLRENGE